VLSVVYISTALSLADKHFKPRPQNKFRTLYGFFTSSERCRDFSCSSDVGFVPTASSECLKENASSDVVAVSMSVCDSLLTVLMVSDFRETFRVDANWKK